MKKQSKFLSLVLRHKPEVGNLILDSEGWAPVSDVLRALNDRFGSFSRTELNTLVATNDKQRFSFNPHGNKIRANQGHSAEVDLGLPVSVPPPQLYHGTKFSFMGSILHKGLLPQSRQHVHLSPDLKTAKIVADRRSGPSAILVVDTTAVPGPFYLSNNGVWLVDAVPPSAISYYTELM